MQYHLPSLWDSKQLDYRVKKNRIHKRSSARILDGRVNLSILTEMTAEEIAAQLRVEGGQRTCF